MTGQPSRSEHQTYSQSKSLVFCVLFGSIWFCLKIRYPKYCSHQLSISSKMTIFSDWPMLQNQERKEDEHVCISANSLQRLFGSLHGPRLAGKTSNPSVQCHWCKNGDYLDLGLESKVDKKSESLTRKYHIPTYPDKLNILARQGF